MSKTAVYKGKKYRVLYKGPTKFGERVKLQFMDGTQEFWVDAHKVSPGAPEMRSDDACPECGRHHRWAPCGYPGCAPGVYCDECNGGGRYCRA